MFKQFDLNKPGKSVYDLSAITGELPGVAGDKLWCINGGEGPGILLCGGIHGDEFEPQVVLRKLAQQLDPQQISGRLFIIPSINFPAAQHGSRISPLDKQNMNRVFPGNGQGTATEKLAAFVTEQLFPLSDLLIDLHTGGNDVQVVPMVFGFATANSAVNSTQLETLMRAWQYPWIQEVEGVASTICGAALAAGLASVEVEGGGGVLRSEELEIIEQGLLRALVHMGVLNDSLSSGCTSPVKVLADATGQVLAPQVGLIEHCVALGTSVQQGDAVARLYSVQGSSKVDILTAPKDGVILRQTRNAWVNEGQLIMNLGVPV